MDKRVYKEFTDILKEELVPAMGCTEPVALAYCAALARKTLGTMPEKVNIYVSPNIIKNVRSVIVPNTKGMKGIETAVAAGIVAGDADAKLQVLANITQAGIDKIEPFLKKTDIKLERIESKHIFHILVEVKTQEHSALVEIVGHHTNVVRIEKDNKKCPCNGSTTKEKQHKTDRTMLSVERIVEYAEEVDLKDVKEILKRQIDYNMAIAKEGLTGKYGANIGKILMLSYGDSVHNRAKAYAAAGSDARMNGCELPVIINSGSGNQGITTSVPVYIYAKELDVSEDTMYRALVVANLTSIHLKTGIGSLSAYCGATSAGCGAAAGITYLYGGRKNEISHTIVNAIAIDSGMICDGAKASCAAKIASSVEAGLLGMQMGMHDSEFYGGDGIVEKGVEKTIRNIGILASTGMQETDRTIIEMMTKADKCEY